MMTSDPLSTLVIQESNDIIFIADAKTHALKFLNSAAQAFLGLEKTEDWLGLPAHQVIFAQGDAPLAPDPVHLSFDQFFSHDNLCSLNDCHFLVKEKLVVFEERDARLCILVDATALQKRLSRQQALVDCIKTLNAPGAFGKSLGEFLQRVAQHHDAQRAYVFEIDEAAQTVSNTYEWCAPGIAQNINLLQNHPVSLIHDWLSAFERTGEFYVSATDEDSAPATPAQAILRTQNITGLMAAPLLSGEKVVGFLGIDNPQCNTDDLSFLRSTTTFIVNAISKNRMSQQLWHLSHCDSLTGLENRHAYTEKITAMEKHPPQQLGIVFADINGLKLANDTYGHAYGDFIILHAAQALRETFDASIFRLGGDEFLVLCPDITQDEFDERVDSLRMRTDEDDELKLSIGAYFSNDMTDVGKLIAHTDKLMYVEKQAYYSSRLSNAGSYHATLSRELQNKIDENRYVVYLQPKIELKTGKVFGAEALVREVADDGTLIPPEKFIPRYESECIIRYIDFFVLEKVCTLLNKWQELLGYPLRISVNLSRVTMMEHNIAEKLRDVCLRNGVTPSSICLEVTESIGDMEQRDLKTLVDQLAAAGFTIALDDFGAKYSNIALLTTMEFSEVKLDKSLIDHLVSNSKSRVIAEHVIKMCEDLNLMVATAEGIETHAQRDLLESLHCSIGQGYLFDKPLPVEGFEQKYIHAQAGA